MPRKPTAPAILARVRKLCLAFPGASERLSHGAPAFFAGTGRKQRCFAMWTDNHHGDGRLALWCAATKASQREHVTARPEPFFVPPYVGPSGWLGVRLDRDLSWDEVAAILEDAFLLVAR